MNISKYKLGKRIAKALLKSTQCSIKLNAFLMNRYQCYNIVRSSPKTHHVVCHRRKVGKTIWRENKVRSDNFFRYKKKNNLKPSAAMSDSASSYEISSLTTFSTLCFMSCTGSGATQKRYTNQFPTRSTRSVIMGVYPFFPTSKRERASSWALIQNETDSFGKVAVFFRLLLFNVLPTEILRSTLSRKAETLLLVAGRYIRMHKKHPNRSYPSGGSRKRLYLRKTTACGLFGKLKMWCW